MQNCWERRFDFWVKLDTDVLFYKAVGFDPLSDMRLRGALFAHTGELNRGIVARPQNFGHGMIIYNIAPAIAQWQWKRGVRTATSNARETIEMSRCKTITNS